MLTTSPKTKKIKITPLPASLENFDIKRTLHWLGSVNNNSYNDTIDALKALLAEDSNKLINLIVTSPGGPTGVAMSFFDLIKNFYRPNLQTIGSGDVDSAGMILFLTGGRRLITPNTTMLLHLASRTFDGARRLSTADMRSILKEDDLKDLQYATVLAEASGGRMSVDKVMSLMSQDTVLSAGEAVELGLAHQILR